jgi:hypothetical protein
MPARLLVCVALAMVAAACGSSTKWPDCPTSTGVSCSPFPEGTYCPGGSDCVECSAGIYIFQPALCICTEGAWACAPTSENPCPNQAGYEVYADPSCTVPYVNPERDAATDATTIDDTDGAPPDEGGTGDGGCDQDHMPECCGFGLPVDGFSCDQDYGAAVSSPNGWTCPNGGSPAPGCSKGCREIIDAAPDASARSDATDGKK